MSNTRKCGEFHGGKLTRPKRLWAGKRRGGPARPMFYGAVPSSASIRATRNMTAGLFRLSQQSKTGGDRLRP